MSLPPAFFDELRSRLSLVQVVGRKVIWDMRKSNQAKGDWWAPCPFHQEKSASFHVDDRKGFYYCFGCHAKGDMISFVRETENAGFMEAIEILAREAGLPMPARDPRAAAVADRRTQLSAVMDAAVQWLRLQLKTSAASDARAYLAKRGLTPDAIDRWDIGFAPDMRQGLFTALTAKGIAPDLIVAAGLCATPDDGGPPYDRFRGRIIFPIRDARGRAISLGGRAMDPNARAKYLNGPETDLFDKGRNLYNLARARDAVGKGAALILAEGYMDVIALSEAGFGGAVAPLGTAVTEDQLRLLWRVSPEPVVMLDGDKAGIRAASRVVEVALPILEGGKSLFFVELPSGKDPDDLLKSEGPAAIKVLLEKAESLVSKLWKGEFSPEIEYTPERKASLKANLRNKISKIQDREVRTYYSQAISFFLLRDIERNYIPPFRRAKKAKDTATEGSRRSMLAMSDYHKSIPLLRERMIIATCMYNLRVLDMMGQGLETTHFSFGQHQAIILTILEHSMGARTEDLWVALAETGLADEARNAIADPYVDVWLKTKSSNDPDIARFVVAEHLAKLTAERGLPLEIEEAEHILSGLPEVEESEFLTRRLREAAATAEKAQRSQSEDRAEYDTAPNGARVKRDEREAFAQLLARIAPEKPLQ